MSYIDNNEKDIQAIDPSGQIHGVIRQYGVDDHGVELKLRDAITAERADHEETVWQAVKRHPTSVAWSLVVSMLVIGEAFDSDLTGGLNAMPAFRRHFGKYVDEKSGYQIPAKWQTANGFAATIGSFFSIILCGQIVNRLGYRKTSIIGLVLMMGAIFGPFFAPSLPIFFLGELLCGIPWGFFICIGPAYASEVSPLALRGLLTIWIQACWFIGHFIESGIVYGTQSMESRWAYRIPFLAQWCWPIPVGILIWMAPESPWWLVRRGKLAEAEKVVIRLGVAEGISPSDRVAEMLRTVEIERSQTEGASYIDCFKGSDLRRTLLGCMIFIFQNYTGYTLAGNIVYFMEQAGFPSSSAFAMGLGTVGIQLCTVTLCAFLMAYFGRRTLYLWGLGFTLCCLLITGIVACVPETPASRWIEAVFIIIMAVQYGLTTGPVTYALIAELSSVRLRAKSVALSRASYYLFGLPTGFIGSYSLNPAAWNLKAKSAFIWLGTGSIVFICTFLFLPEVKGRSFRELDILFHRGVPARKFQTTSVDDEDDQ
ncbi:general substrate transporter [Kockovaella imperatae]|uniref:General substrate transporter n=1 Tax=Kockovaella imperatae TaxID=4999 RepID=A0A1Y1UGK5_9TREE|nr:general substrate transporter [Kockovaella imperatae]ORX37158.1 general substrate transporter [Kockovaella imperatae]